MVAAQEGHLEVVEHLLEHEEDDVENFDSASSDLDRE